MVVFSSSSSLCTKNTNTNFVEMYSPRIRVVSVIIPLISNLSISTSMTSCSFRVKFISFGGIH